MNKLLILSVAGFLAASTCAIAADDAMHGDGMKSDCMAMHMKMMDANGDGMISKTEYMDAMAKNWEKMSKSKDGMVSVDDMKMSMEKMHKEGCTDKMSH